MKHISKEIKIGATFIISIALLYIGVNFLKGSNVFSHDNTYYIVVSNAGGVAPSSVINTNGYQVGTVSSVNYDYSSPNRIVVSLRVNESLRIPKGSRAYLVNELLGGVSIDLRLSQSTAYYADDESEHLVFKEGFIAENAENNKLSDKAVITESKSVFIDTAFIF